MTLFHKEFETIWETLLQNARNPEREEKYFSALKASIVRCEAEIGELGLHEFSAQRFSVSELDIYDISDERGIIFPKINHGFWEQLYTLFSKDIDPKRMRVVDLEPHATRYIASGMLTTLFALCEFVSDQSQDGISFSGMHLGFSLNNGSQSHHQILNSFELSSPFEKRVVTGAAIGGGAFFEALFGRKKISLADGCFGKKGLREGYLRAFIEQRLPTVSKVVFVVPPHLKGICLENCSVPTSELFISGKFVHEEWEESILATAYPILRALDRGEKLMVFCQAGVVSGLLGLFLALAAQKLQLKRGRLDYLDLGQVLDIANPSGAGPWLARHDPVDASLFYCNTEQTDVGVESPK